MKARDAIRKLPVTVTAEATLVEVAKLMDKAVVGAVVVVDGGVPMGIVTDRDLVMRGIARDLQLDRAVMDVMSINLVTLDADADLRDAIQLFSSHPIRRLPLVEDGKMVGMLTVDDLVMDCVSDLALLIRPVIGEVIFGHPES
jgi:signal-transduction protein with cAMP-binding, CBS, and nucleotidyltransferase domain